MSKFKPTDSELEILQVLWQNGSCSVRDINETLNMRRDVGYTTTLKLMQIMNEKQLVIRDTSQKSHIYDALVKEDDTKNDMISDFINVAFRGSTMNLVLQALGNTESSKAELDELKALITELENKS